MTWHPERTKLEPRRSRDAAGVAGAPAEEGLSARSARAGRTLAVAYGAVTAALTLAATLYVRVPASGSGQYFNLGEAVIYTAALLAGPWIGAAGAVGAAVGDLVQGFTAWAPLTLAIKAIEGALVGWLAFRRRGTGPWGEGPGSRPWYRDLVAVVPGALWMVAGYAGAAWLLLGPGAVPVELFIDTLQVSSSAAVAVALAPALRGALRRSAGHVSAPPG